MKFSMAAIDWMSDDGNWVCDGDDFGGASTFNVGGWQSVTTIGPADATRNFCDAFEWLGYRHLP